MQSIWSNTISLPAFQALDTDIQTDTLIIGGGITGILCAYMLEEAGIDYVLAEADRICHGVTQNTTAKITIQHGLIYHKTARRYGLEKSLMYLEANKVALEQFGKLCQNIDCDFERKDSFVYSIDGCDTLIQELNTLVKLGYPAQYVEHLPLPFSLKGAVKFPDQAQFHPLKFLAHIAKGLRIYEHTMVRDLSEGTAYTDHGKIKASRVIVTTHFPFLNWHGSYFLKMYQHRSYVIALEHTPDVQGMYVDEADTGLSFRNHNNLLLIGSGDHRTGKRGGNWTELSSFARKYYPNAKEIYHWATQDCMSLDQIPYIGQYSRHTPDIYVATGFNKWGMTSAMAAAMILKDRILERENPFAEVFSPSRSMLHPQLAVNAFEAATNLVHFSKRRCTHMGCALKWNPQEHSWDCPCHGSRYEENGKLINNPAMRDMK